MATSPPQPPTTPLVQSRVMRVSPSVGVSLSVARVLPPMPRSRRLEDSFGEPVDVVSSAPAGEVPTPPTAIRPATVAPPAWTESTPSFQAAFEYLLCGEAEAATSPQEVLPPRHERAHAWRRAVVALLDGRELRTFQAEALAHVLLDRDVFALAAVKLTLG